MNHREKFENRHERFLRQMERYQRDAEKIAKKGREAWIRGGSGVAAAIPRHHQTDRGKRNKEDGPWPHFLCKFIIYDRQRPDSRSYFKEASNNVSYIVKVSRIRPATRAQATNR
jgi:hypothetical protein